MDDMMSKDDSMMASRLRETLMKIVDKAESEGKLEPLAAMIKELNLTTDAKALFMASQLDDKTKGKSPEELASMYKSEPAMVKIVLAKVEKPGAEMGMEEESTSEEAMPSVSSKMDKMKKAAEMSDMAEEGMEDDGKAKAYRMRMGM
jgi:hypothetical protein